MLLWLYINIHNLRYKKAKKIMNRTTIMLPETLKMKAMNLAKNEGVSLGEFIRESIIMRFRKNTTPIKQDPFFSESLVFSGNSPKDLAENHDDYLYE